MPISLRLGPQLEARLAKASRKLRATKTRVIRRSLEAYLAQIEPGRTPYELGEDLFGTDERGGSDLSSTFKKPPEGQALCEVSSLMPVPSSRSSAGETSIIRASSGSYRQIPPASSRRSLWSPRCATS